MDIRCILCSEFCPIVSSSVDPVLFSFPLVLLLRDIGYAILLTLPARDLLV